MAHSEDARYARLRLFNAAMGILHLLQGGLMILLSNDFTLPLTTSFLEYDPQTDSIDPVTKTAFDLRIGPLVAVFLLISAVAHFLVASPGIYRWYVLNLKKRINFIRWYEYALSSSVMIVVIAMLSGMYDLPALMLILTLNATMQLFGLMMELHNQATEKTNWTSFIFGVFAGIVPWIAIALYFGGAAGSELNAIPTFVYWIYVSIFLFYNVFALNMFLQYKGVGPWRDYLFGERTYILLSLLAKSALAWQVFAGTLRPA
ncbi:MAG: heliorhodopsin HeR [Dehalococcoidia bacterium]